MYMSCFSKNVSSKNTLQKSEVNIKHYWAGPDVSKKEKQERKKARDSRFIQFSREDNSRENLMVGSRSRCCITTNVLSHIFQDVNGTVWAIVQWVDWPGIASRIVLFYHFHIIVYSVQFRSNTDKCNWSINKQNNARHTNSCHILMSTYCNGSPARKEQPAGSAGMWCGG